MSLRRNIWSSSVRVLLFCFVYTAGMRLLCVAVCVLAVSGLVYGRPDNTRSHVQREHHGRDNSRSHVQRDRDHGRDNTRSHVQRDRDHGRDNTRSHVQREHHGRDNTRSHVQDDCVHSRKTAVHVDRHFADDTMDPEVNMNISEVIRRWGYPAEEHEVVTSDSYILSVNRIPHGLKDQGRGAKPAVLLQHGLLCAGSNWVTNPPSSSLGYVLADQGYDVWLANSRGSTWSRKHQWYTPEEDAFWDFSYDEMAQQDLPAVVDHILKTTGQEQIFYIGHSQGTTIAFIAFSSMPELASKIKLFIALAPVATVAHVYSPIGLTKLTLVPAPILKVMLGNQEFLPQSETMEWLAEGVCSDKTLSKLCEGVLFVLCGFNEDNLNLTRIPVYFTHTPAGTSVKNMLHWRQALKRGKLMAYDYGPFANVVHYGKLTPPEYNVADMKVPTVLFSGGQDFLADPEDVAKLVLQVSDLVSFKQIQHWDHLDFIWGVDAPEQLFPDILEHLSAHT